MAEVGTIEEVERLLLEKVGIVDGKLVATAIGVAYIFEGWILKDGATRKPGGLRIEPSLSPEEIQAAVDEQGAVVRRLKSGMAEFDRLDCFDRRRRELAGGLFAILEGVLESGAADTAARFVI